MCRMAAGEAVARLLLLREDVLYNSAGETLPLPCVSTVFVAKILPFLAAPQVICSLTLICWTMRKETTANPPRGWVGGCVWGVCGGCVSREGGGDLRADEER